MDTAIFRIYMPQAAKVKDEKAGFFKRLLKQSLSSFLLKQAREDGIEQGMFYRAISGYLRGKPLVSDMSEVPPPNLPFCIEMIDREGKLTAFVSRNRKFLDDCRVIIYKATDVIGGRRET